MKKSGTSSSQPYQNLQASSPGKMDLVGQPTTPARYLAHQTPESNPTPLGHDPSGSTSTQEKASRTPTPSKLLSLSNDSGYPPDFPHRFMLAQVTVCIAIGHWTKSFNLLRGIDMHPDSSACVTKRSYMLMGAGLVISRLYYERQEHTTESMENIDLSRWGI